MNVVSIDSVAVMSQPTRLLPVFDIIGELLAASFCGFASHCEGNATLLFWCVLHIRQDVSMLVVLP